MKNQVKRFGQFVNENKSRSMSGNRVSTKHGFHERHSSGGGHLVATVELSRSMSGEFATIIFGGEERSVDEMDSMRATWQNILDTANDMGADLIYSVEDEEIISQEDIDSLDDQPSGWDD
jgi:hypothetical protein